MIVLLMRMSALISPYYSNKVNLCCFDHNVSTHICKLNKSSWYSFKFGGIIRPFFRERERDCVNSQCRESSKQVGTKWKISTFIICGSIRRSHSRRNNEYTYREVPILVSCSLFSWEYLNTKDA